jgi:hypothetical protein
MDIEGRGKSSSYDVGHAPASTPLRPQTSEEKAAAATRVADDLGRCAEFVHDDVGAVRSAVTAGDLADWVDAAQDARNGLDHLRQLVGRAPSAMRDAADPQVRTRLESAPQLLTDAESLVSGLPAMPSLDAPIVRCADAVAAVLPPNRALGWREQRALADVVAEQATHSDLIALRSILEGKTQHPLTSRFQQFSPSTRKLLVRILYDRDLAARAEARQTAQRQARRTKARANASTSTAPPASMAPAPIGSTGDHVPAGGSSASPVNEVVPAREGELLPHREEMEHAFGGSFSDVKAHKGMAAELAPVGAQALTVGNEVMFADATPSLALVAHEATHLVQNKQAGASVAMASGVVAPRDSEAEAEADTMARLVAAHGPGVRLPPITAAPAAHVHLAPKSSVPEVQVDKTKEAEQLRGFIALRKQEAIVHLLEQNARPERMYALHRAYGSMLVPDVRAALTEPSFLARARVYLGEQMALDARISSRGNGDTDAILADLERVPDARALDLFVGDAVSIAWTATAPSSAPDPAATYLPATTTLTAVKDALRARLSADDYARAMRLLMTKADRAIAGRAAQPHLPAGSNLEGFTFTIDDLMDPAHPDAPTSPIALSPVMQARVDLAEERIRAADAQGSWLQDPKPAAQAFVALAELNRVERRALAMRLHDRPLDNVLGGMSLGDQALEADDATVIRDAILVAQELAYLQGQALRGVGFDAALARAGEVIRAARARLAQLPPTAPESERQKAQAEVDRLEAMFFGPQSQALGMLRRDAVQGGEPDGGMALHQSRLHAMGADPVTIASEQLIAIPVGDAAALIATLRKVAPQNRLEAMQRSGQLDALSRQAIRVTPDQRELLTALIWQGQAPQLGPLAGQPDAGSPHPSPEVALGPPVILPPGLALSPMGPRPEIVIALHDILDAMGRGAANEVLARLARMPKADAAAICTDPRYQARLNALPEGEPRSPQRDLKESLRNVKDNDTAREALLHYPGPGGDGDVYQKVLLEAMGAQVDARGQARMRRAYVLVERLGGQDRIAKDPTCLAALAAEDRSDVEQLMRLLGERDHLIDKASDKETASQIVLGQPQLTDTAQAALDPTQEAEFMFYRLREAAGVRDGVAVMDSFSNAGPAADEAVTEFMMLYRRVKPGGVDRGELAQLADLYHRALRHLESYRKANDSFASSAAQVVGAVVATVVVTIASGGTLGPVAIGALAGLSGAAASAATGAAIRIDNTTLSVVKDAGTGMIEGIAAAAGAPLAARIVRGTTTGMAAGRAAVTAGARAAGHASGGMGASIAEAAIDGAIGGAAGDLFQTATDEATWDRGISEAFAALLAAIARGAGTGGLGGGVIAGAIGGVARLSRLGARVGDATAHDVGRLLESAGVGTQVLDHVSDHGLDELGRFWSHLKLGSLDEAEKALARVEGLPPHVGPRILDRARARIALDSLRDLGPIHIEGVSLEPEFIADREFRKLAGSKRGDAVILIEDGKPRFIAREGAPVSALREEYVHLAQWASDPAMRMRMARLGEDQLAPATWKTLPAAEKLELHLGKLEVEADAQRRIIADLSGRAEKGDAEAVLRIQDADETLFKLGSRIDELHAVRGQAHIDSKKLGIDEPPRLFAGGAQTPKRITGPKADTVRDKVIGKRVEDVKAELGRLGYSPHEVKQPDGTSYWRMTRSSATTNDIPHLTVDDETGLIREADGRSSFSERKADAAREWRRSSDDLQQLNTALGGGALDPDGAVAARRALKDAAPGFRAELERRVAARAYDEGGAGLLAKWSKLIEQLDETGLVKLSEVIALLPDNATKAGLDEFRRALRRRTVDALITKVQDPAERTKALYKLIDLQPDNASGGHLFTEFREEVMKRTVARMDPEGNTHTSVLDGSPDQTGGSPVYDVESFGTTSKPPEFTGRDLAKTRRPDGVAKINAEIEGQLPGGRYAIEDKTGDNAFDIQQAEDYARRSDPSLARRVDKGYSETDVGNATGGFKLRPESTTAEYDGIVYVFSRRSEAERALFRMNKNEMTQPLLGNHPGGIHVMFMDDAGTLRMLSELPKRIP